MECSTQMYRTVHIVHTKHTYLIMRVGGVGGGGEEGLFHFQLSSFRPLFLSLSLSLSFQKANMV